MVFFLSSLYLKVMDSVSCRSDGESRCHIYYRQADRILTNNSLTDVRSCVLSNEKETRVAVGGGGGKGGGRNGYPQGQM